MFCIDSTEHGLFVGMSQHEALGTDFNEDPMDCKGPNL